MPQFELASIVMKDAVSVLICKPKTGPDAGKWAIPGDFVKDGERMIETSARSLKEKMGLTVIPKQILFLSEVVEPDVHRAVAFCFAECASSGDPQVDPETVEEARFVDPRDLKKYQDEGMSSLTEEAFYKFSLILKAQAAAMPRGGIV